MKCHSCNLVEMMVMVRNDKEVVYYCPKCHEIVKISVEEEENIVSELTKNNSDK